MQIRFEQYLKSSIDQRFKRHSDRSLHDYVHANHLFREYEDSFFEFSVENRQQLTACLADDDILDQLTDHCVHCIQTYTNRKNQFINYTDDFSTVLRAIYRDFLLRIRDAVRESHSARELSHVFGGIAKIHHERLKHTLESYCEANQSDAVLHTVPCDEYSAPLQLQVLGIDVSSLKEPVLDVGCGASGTLVTYLKERGIDVCGVDRYAPPGPMFLRQNWFNIDVSPDRWGTVIAHHALSTHFLHCHGHEPGNAEKYARLYMDVLSSLKPGGSFYYAPGLPFMEQHLAQSERYLLTTRPIPLPGGHDQLRTVSYSACIRRK